MNGLIRGTNFSLPATNMSHNSFAMDSLRKNDIFGSPGRYQNLISPTRSYTSQIPSGSGTSGLSRQTFKELPSPGTQVSLGRSNVAETSFSSVPSTSGTYRPLGTIPPSVSRDPSYNLRQGLNFSEGTLGNTSTSIPGNYRAMSSTLGPNTFPSKVQASGPGSISKGVSFASPAVTFGPGARGDFAKGLTFGASTPMQSGMRSLWAQQEAQMARNAVSMRNIGTVAKGAGVGATLGMSAISGPAAAAGAISQALGEGVNQIMSNKVSTQITSDYSNNIRQHGVNVGLNAELIRQSQENTRNYASTGGTIGALFGPIGALAGHAIGSALSNSSVNLNTASSFGSMINPTDSRVAQAASTSSPSGQSTQVDNVN